MNRDDAFHGDLWRAFVARSVADARFRQQLLVDPNTALWESLGVRIPAGFRIRFVERGPNTDALVVLPDFRPERPVRVGVAAAEGEDER